jgi:two-component system chemotaxis sensor kinase CheA
VTEKQRKYLDIFAREAADHLAALRAGALSLEGGGEGGEGVRELLRHVHTLKGASRMLDLEATNLLAHALEDCLKEVEGGERSRDGALVDLVLLAADTIEALVEEARGHGRCVFRHDRVIEGLRRGEVPEDATDPELLEHREGSGADGSGAAGDSVRIAVDRLDRMVNLIGEGTLAVHQLQERAEHLGAFEQDLQAFAQRLRREDNRRDLRVLLERLQSHRLKVQKEILSFHLLNEMLAEEADGMRLIPFAPLVGDLRRVVRDLARDEGKQAVFEIEGEDVAIDRMLWEALRPALLHMLRNAVDHGIEPPEERRRQGKDPTGRLLLSAGYEHSGVCLRLWDDGRGMDPGRVRELAVEKGVASAEEVADMNDEQALYLILRPGFSSRDIITDLSGRGIGMDVVHNCMERIKGNLHIHSRPGEGTEIALQLPLTLARMNALVVRCEGERYLIPLQYVRAVVPVREQDLVVQGGREMIRFEGRLFPLRSMSETLGLPRRTLIEQRRIFAVIMGFREQSAAWAVTAVERVREIVIKGLGSQLKSVPGFSGATLLEEGLPALILSVPELFSRLTVSGETRLHAQFAAARERMRRGRVLVVDDSVTTRTMERNILEGQGYRVEVAVSGEEALAVLARQDFDLIVTDIEMPGIDGFELTRRIRQTQDGAEVPVIIVSSRATDEDRRRGIEVGAQAYIVKGSFEQGKLMDAVETLIG